MKIVEIVFGTLAIALLIAEDVTGKIWLFVPAGIFFSIAFLAWRKLERN